MISVIMPAYNASKFIREAIESILNQTYQDFELIVVDDGSKDDTVEIIQSYVEKDPRVRLIQNQHGGANKARNTAIEQAQYPWIACMDADDVALPERLEKQMKAAEANPEVVVWGTHMHQINEAGEVIGNIQIGPVTLEEFHNLDRTRHVIMVVNPTAMFKREVALKVGGYNESLPAAQDVEMWDRMSAYGPVLTIPEKLLKYRLHGNSISATKFFDQRMYTHFVTTRYAIRQQGGDLTLEQYVADYQGKPPLVRLTRYVGNLGRHYYRTTGVMISRKKYPQAIMYLAAGFVLNPSFVFGRVRNRLFPRRFV